MGVSSQSKLYKALTFRQRELGRAERQSADPDEEVPWQPLKPASLKLGLPFEETSRGTISSTCWPLGRVSEYLVPVPWVGWSVERAGGGEALTASDASEESESICKDRRLAEFWWGADGEVAGSGFGLGLRIFGRRDRIAGLVVLERRLK